MNTVGTPLLWIGFAIMIVSMLIIDFFLQVYRSTLNITMKQAVVWSIVWVTLSLLFCFTFWSYLASIKGRTVADSQALAFLTGYMIEKALTIDNVFVWLMLFNYFAIPTDLQNRILIFYGVPSTIILRTIMIFSSNWLISKFEWLLYIFGIFLVFTGVNMSSVIRYSINISHNTLMEWLCSRYSSLTKKIKNSLPSAMPKFLVLILIEVSNVIFTFDSIPAIFSVTTDPFIVLTSNLLAILGLRTMYFLLADVANRFSMLKYGLSMVLIFIGIKILMINFYKIPISISLGIVFGILAVTLLVNVWMNKKNNKRSSNDEY